MNKEKFNKDVKEYEDKLLKTFDPLITKLLVRSYCMGYCQLSNELFEEFDSYIDLDPVLDKITSLSNEIKNIEQNNELHT